MLLSACGFALRGVTPMPFDTLYVGIPDTTQFGADVRRSLRAASPNTKLVNSPKEAQAILQQVNDARSLREVSLNAQGRVESYELGINFTFRLIDAKGNALIPDTTLSIYREMPYDDQIVQAARPDRNAVAQGHATRPGVAPAAPHDRARRAQGVRESWQERGRRGRAGVRPERGPAGQHSRPWQTPSTTDAPLSR